MIRYFPNKALVFFVVLFFITIIPSPLHAAILRSQPAIERSLGITSAQLEQQGCDLVTYSRGENGSSWQYTDGHKTTFIQASDAGEPVLHRSKASPYSPVGPTVYTWYPNTFSCPADVFNSIQAKAPTNIISFLDDPVPFLLQKVLDVISGIIAVVAKYVTGPLFFKLLQQGSFISNDVVKTGWPFIQGFANLGFIFALLYIALATTLRLESVSTSMQRLLPKLLIGALLVNFSLVIGGLCIDLSRLIMAAEIRLLGGPNASGEQLTHNILRASQAYQTQGINEFAKDIEVPNAYQIIVNQFRGILVEGAIMIGFGVIALNLFIRYIMLIILLIFSPIPYLALALPQTTKFFQQWWMQFIKWVAYGPIVLFFLIVITKINSVNLLGDATVFAYVAQFCVVITLLYAGHIFSKKAAGIGSDMVMNWAKENPRKALVGLSAATGVGLIPALAAIGGAGVAKYTGSSLKNAGGDFKDKVSKDFMKRARSDERYLGIPGSGVVTKFFAGPERDEKGNLKKGQDSVGSWAAKRIGKRIGIGDPNIRNQANELKQALSRTPLSTRALVITPPADLQKFLNGAALSQGHIAKAFDDGTTPLDTSSTLRYIIEQTDNKGHLMGLAQNEDYLREIGETGRTEFIRALNTNRTPGLSPSDKADVVNRIVRTVKDKDL